VTRLAGRVYSHTRIRVPGAAHADRGPFALVLVELDDGGRVLGRLESEAVPEIGAAVAADAEAGSVPIFRFAEES
jgi:uncharacterized OB-fold protein